MQVSRPTLSAIILTLILCWSSMPIYAQFDSAPKYKIDTIHIKKNRFLYINDKAYYISKDTTIYVADTVDFLVRKNTTEKTDEFYRQVKEKMSKNRVSQYMYDFLFHSEEGIERHDDQMSEMRFVPYKRRTIDTVVVKHLAVFGSSINDTSYFQPNKYADYLNKVHVHTRDWIIRKNLMFKPGEKINPNDLVDSERILRRLEYIKDARIFVKKTSRGMAQVDVVTKDVFPYNFLLSPKHDNQARFGISNINIGGIGHELEYNYIREGGSELFYRVRNIEGTFIDGELNLAKTLFRTGAGAVFERPFVTQETKYAGGAEITKYEWSDLNYNFESEVATRFFYDRYYRDIWLGRAFKTNFKSQFLGFHSKANAVASIRYSIDDFSNTPVVSPDTNFFFHDKRSFFIGIGLQSREYYKDQFIVNYGRTEDIPTGASVGIITGPEFGQFRDRYYLGGYFSRGGYVNKFGYLNTIFSLGAFFGNGHLHDGIFKIESDYFTKLFVLNQFKFRQFIHLTYSQAIRPNEDYILRTEKDLGIRGVFGFFLRSTSLLNIKLESLLFTPVDFVGFRMAVFGFTDVSYSTSVTNSQISSDLYSGLGFGLRFRNDNLAFSTIQFRFGFYPSVPPQSSTDEFQIATSNILEVRDFDFKEPEVISFTR